MVLRHGAPVGRSCHAATGVVVRIEGSTAMAPICEVERERYATSGQERVAVSCAVSYIGRGLRLEETRALVNSSDWNYRARSRESPDNGRTWSDWELLYEERPRQGDVTESGGGEPARHRALRSGVRHADQAGIPAPAARRSAGGAAPALDRRAALRRSRLLPVVRGRRPHVGRRAHAQVRVRAGLRPRGLGRRDVLPAQRDVRRPPARHEQRDRRDQRHGAGAVPRRGGREDPGGVPQHLPGRLRRGASSASSAAGTRRPATTAGRPRSRSSCRGAPPRADWSSSISASCPTAGCC